MAPAHIGGTPLGPDEVELKSGGSAKSGCLFLLVFAVIWNGIVGVFVYQAIRGNLMPAGWGQVFIYLFLSPFVLVGLVMLGALAHQFLAMFNKGTHVWIDRRAILPGETVRLRWHSADSGRLERLLVFVEGLEEATYQRGSSTTTATHVFHRELLYDSGDTKQGQIERSGQADVAIPPGAVPTFVSDWNGVLWRVYVYGRIRRWPDINRSFVLPVLAEVPPADGERRDDVYRREEF